MSDVLEVHVAQRLRVGRCDAVPPDGRRRQRACNNGRSQEGERPRRRGGCERAHQAGSGIKLCESLMRSASRSELAMAPEFMCLVPSRDGPVYDFPGSFSLEKVVEKGRGSYQSICSQRQLYSGTFTCVEIRELKPNNILRSRRVLTIITS